MADSSQYNLSLVITANNKAVEELNKIGASVDKVKGGVLNLSESTKKTLKTVGATATAIAGSVALLGKSFIDAAVEIEPVKRAYQGLTDTIGEDSEKMLKSLQQASKGAVKDYDLMLSANRAMKLGVTQNTEDMTDLMKIARLYGQQMGQDVTQSFNDIVTGLGRGSPMILDNLGIIIDSEKAYEDYAKQLGKTASELTKAEKTQALVSSTLIEGRKALEEFGEPLPTMQERITALRNQFEHIKVSVGEALVPVIERLLTAITPVIERIVERIDKNPELTANIMIVVGAVAGLTAVLSGLALALPGITTAIGVLTNKRTLLATAIAGVYGALEWLEGKILSTDEKVQMYQRSIDELKQKLDLGEISQEEFTQAVEEYNQKIQEAYAESNTLGQYLKNELDYTLKVMTFDTNARKEGLQSFGIVCNAIGDMFDRIAEFLINTMIKARDEFGDIVNSVGGFFDSLASAMGNLAENGFTKLFNTVERLTTKFKNLISTIKEALSLAGEKVSGAVSSVVNFVSGKASGGDVYGKTPYLVGEHGPELFIPSQKGNIVPTNQVSNAYGDVNINMNGITIRSEADIQSLADEITRRIKLEKNFGIA